LFAFPAICPLSLAITNAIAVRLICGNGKMREMGRKKWLMREN